MDQISATTFDHILSAVFDQFFPQLFIRFLLQFFTAFDHGVLILLYLERSTLVLDKYQAN